MFSSAGERNECPLSTNTIATWCLTFLVGLKSQGTKPGQKDCEGEPHGAEAGHADGKWLHLLSAPTLTLVHPQRFSLKVRQSLGRWRVTDLCERNGMLEWQSHQGNYGYAPGRSDPENRSDLQQPRSHSCLLSIRSLRRQRWRGSHGLHSEAGTEEAAVTTHIR